MPQLKILVIGANRGIGFELAKKLKEQGHHVFGTYRPSSEHDPSVQRLISLSIPAFEADYSAELTLSTLPHLYTTHPLGWPFLDVLINSGGIYFPFDTLPFHAFTASDILEHFKINTLGPFLTSKYLYPLLVKSPWGGRIVNVSSDFGSIRENGGGNVAYRLSKAALNQLTATVAAEGSRPGLFELLPGDGPGAPEGEWERERAATTGVGDGAGAGSATETGGKTLTAISVHPGFVPTATTGYQGRDDLGKSVEGIVRLVERLCEDDGEARGNKKRKKGADDLEAGGFYRWDGVKLAF